MFKVVTTRRVVPLRDQHRYCPVASFRSEKSEKREMATANQRRVPNTERQSKRCDFLKKKTNYDALCSYHTSVNDVIR